MNRIQFEDFLSQEFNYIPNFKIQFQRAIENFYNDNKKLKPNELKSTAKNYFIKELSKYIINLETEYKIKLFCNYIDNYKKLDD